MDRESTNAMTCWSARFYVHLRVNLHNSNAMSVMEDDVNGREEQNFKCHRQSWIIEILDHGGWSSRLLQTSHNIHPVFKIYLPWPHLHDLLLALLREGRRKSMGKRNITCLWRLQKSQSFYSYWSIWWRWWGGEKEGGASIQYWTGWEAKGQGTERSATWPVVASWIVSSCRHRRNDFSKRPTQSWGWSW